MSCDLSDVLVTEFVLLPITFQKMVLLASISRQFSYLFIDIIHIIIFKCDTVQGFI